jgi:hypothetical protein
MATAIFAEIRSNLEIAGGLRSPMDIGKRITSSSGTKAGRTLRETACLRARAAIGCAGIALGTPCAICSCMA